MSAVDDALAELKKAEELLAAAQAVDAAELPKVEVAPVPATESVAPVVAVEVPAAATATVAPAAPADEAKRGPMIKNGKLYPSVR